MLGWSQQSHCACHCAATEHRPRATTARCRPYPSAVSVSTAAVEPTSGTGGPPAPPAGRPMQLASLLVHPASFDSITVWTDGPAPAEDGRNDDFMTSTVLIGAVPAAPSARRASRRPFRTPSSLGLSLAAR